MTKVGLRYDEGKNRLDLIPPEWMWALGDVLTQGAKKYEERNWELGMAWTKPVGCAMRHLLKFACGERYDVETGCHHLAMAAWNMLALMSYDIHQLGDNDLSKLGTLPALDRVRLQSETIDRRGAALEHQAHLMGPHRDPGDENP